VKNYRSAQTFLALVFLIGGIIVLAGITLAFLANSFVDSGYGFQDSVIAEATAASGVQDALLQIDRNPAFSNTSGYSLPVASNTATVTVTQNSPSSGFITILSKAIVSGHVKKVNVILSENTTTDQLNVISWQEVQ
jgi:hypothetical protein